MAVSRDRLPDRAAELAALLLGGKPEDLARVIQELQRLAGLA